MNQPMNPHAIEAMLVNDIVADAWSAEIIRIRPADKAAAEIRDQYRDVYSSRMVPTLIDTAILGYIFDRVDWMRIVRLAERRIDILIADDRDSLIVRTTDHAQAEVSTDAYAQQVPA